MIRLTDLVLSIFLFLILGTQFVGADGFPCQINDPTKFKIYLWGEKHSTDKSKLNRNRQILEVAEGRQVLALEGLFFDPSKDFTSGSLNIVGFDASFPYGLSLLASLFLSTSKAFLDQTPADIDPLKANFVMNSLRVPYLLEAWDRLRSQRIFAFKSEEKLAKEFDLVFKNSSSKNASDHYIAVTSDLDSAFGFMQLLGDLMKEYTVMAKAPDYKNKMHVPDNIDLTYNYVRGESITEFLEEITVKWRNQLMLDNIAQIFCKAQIENKNLSVIVGDNHSKELKSKLELMSGSTEFVEYHNVESEP